MKWTLYLAALLGAILIPIRRTDVGKLQPIEVIALSEKNGTVRLETDTEDSGEGYTIEEAVADLKQTTPGVVYLDIAEYLLLEPGCEEHLDELQVWLKGSTLVCMKEGTMDLKDAAKYGKTIVNISQCMQGSVEMGRYDTGYQLQEAGVISGHDSTVESAVTKLMFLQAYCKDVHEVRKMMSESIRGEMSV